MLRHRHIDIIVLFIRNGSITDYRRKDTESERENKVYSHFLFANNATPEAVLSRDTRTNGKIYFIRFFLGEDGIIVNIFVPSQFISKLTSE